MKEYNHDLKNVSEACGVSTETVTKIRFTVITGIINESKTMSEVVEKIEKIILKDVENYLRPFIIDYMMFHTQGMKSVGSVLTSDSLKSIVESFRKECKDCDDEDCDEKCR